MRERHLYNLGAVHEFFLSAEAVVRSFDKGNCRAHFPSPLSIVDFWGHILWSSEKHEYSCLGSHSVFKFLFGIDFKKQFVKI